MKRGRVLGSWEQVYLLKRAIAFRKKRGDFWNRHIGQFFRFELMKAAPIYPAFTEEAGRVDLVEKLPDVADKGFIVSESAEQ